MVHATLVFAGLTLQEHDFETPVSMGRDGSWSAP